MKPQPAHSSSIPFYRGESREALAQALADQVAGELGAAIAARGQASLVVSGGSTPLLFFEALEAKPLDWSKVTVTLADERFVDPSHKDSNERLLREHLLTGGARFISLRYPPVEQTVPSPGNREGEQTVPSPIHGEELGKGHTSPLEQTADAADAALRTIPLPFDVVILGMGDDAHTASLFPHHPQLKAALDPAQAQLCLPITDSPKPPPERLTLTFNALTNARRLYVHITGEAKKPVAERAIARHDPQAMPISAFFHQARAPIAIWWAA